MVEHGEVGGQQHAQLGQAQVVDGRVGQPLPPADDVVGEVADQAAGQRRQPRVAGRPAPTSAATVSRSTASGSPLGGHAGRRLRPSQTASPSRSVSVARCARRRRSSATRPAAPCSADSSRNVPGPPAELAVDPDRRLAVGQQPAGRPGPPGALRAARSAEGRPRPGSTAPRGHRVAPPGSPAPGAVDRQLGVEAGAVAGVAGRADLVDADQHGVAVAVERHRRTHWRCPDVSPLTQYSCRLRDQYVARPVVSVRCSASSSIQPTISTSPVSYCWTTAAPGRRRRA